MLDRYVAQVRLLLSMLQDIANEAVFALKGGTAINLFYRDMPRLSVDIDLTYLPVADRQSSLQDIDDALDRIILEAVRTTAEWTTAKIRAIRELLDETGATIRRRIPKIYSRELAELIFVHPYCRIGDVVKADIAKRQTAAV